MYKFAALLVLFSISANADSYTWPNTSGYNINVPASQMRYVSMGGADTNNCTIISPCLTLGAAESQITDASASKQYVIYIGPGTYTAPATKEVNIFWVGSGQFVTFVTNPTGGMTITHSTGFDSAVFKDLNMTFGSAKPFTITQSGGIGSVVSGHPTITGTLSITLENVRYGGAGGLTYNGELSSVGNSNFSIMNSLGISNTAFHSVAATSYSTYFGSPITLDATSTITNTPFNVTCSTTQNSTTVTCSGLSGTNIAQGDTISGTGIPVGALVGPLNFGANTFTISQAATATNAGVSLTFAFNTAPSISAYDSVTSGFTMSGVGIGSLNGGYSQGGITLNTAGTTLTATAGNLGGTLTLASGTILNRSTGASEVNYPAATPSDWPSPAPTTVQLGLDTLATEIAGAAPGGVSGSIQTNNGSGGFRGYSNLTTNGSNLTFDTTGVIQLGDVSTADNGCFFQIMDATPMFSFNCGVSFNRAGIFDNQQSSINGFAVDANGTVTLNAGAYLASNTVLKIEQGTGTGQDLMQVLANDHSTVLDKIDGSGDVWFQGLNSTGASSAIGSGGSFHVNDAGTDSWNGGAGVGPVYLTGGAVTGPTGNGGTLYFVGGTGPTGPTGGSSAEFAGAISLQGGLMNVDNSGNQISGGTVIVSGASNTGAGAVSIIGGGSFAASTGPACIGSGCGNGGSVAIQGGAASAATGPGLVSGSPCGGVQIQGGFGDGAQGNPAAINVDGCYGANYNGSAVTVTAGAGVAPNGSGGPINISGGAGIGGGNGGDIILTPGGAGVTGATGQIQLSGPTRLPVQPNGVTPQCDSNHTGDTVYTSLYLQCVCNGTSFVHSATGATACVF